MQLVAFGTTNPAKFQVGSLHSPLQYATNKQTACDTTIAYAQTKQSDEAHLHYAPPSLIATTRPRLVQGLD